MLRQALKFSKAFRSITTGGFMLFKNQDKITTLLKEYEQKISKQIPLVKNKERFSTIMSAIDVITTFILDASPDAIIELRQGSMNPKDIYYTVITNEIIIQKTKAFFNAVTHGDNFEIYQQKKGNILLSIRFSGAYSAAPLNDVFYFPDEK